MSDPLVLGDRDPARLTDRIIGPLFSAASRLWWVCIGITGLGTLALLLLLAWSVVRGTGLWGNNIPAAWGFPIINFVWWIGIGHAGTFISGILLLFEQRWRNSINRIAEAMTLFAVVQAAIFPLLHMGRPWFFYWLVPYPATMGTWPQFRSALPWDAAAIATYGTVSLLFWYLGLLPDLAVARDRAPSRTLRIVYGFFSLGWNGSTSAWRRFRVAYGLLAGLATPLVISVHSIVSSDFAITLAPGWHSTIFPPYFVAGAILSGFAMVVLLVLPTRRVLGLHDVITPRHLDNLCKMILVTGWFVLYAYIVETFIGWYSGEPSEQYQYLVARPFGPYGLATWGALALNGLTVQVFWCRGARRSPVIASLVSVGVLVGMWLERFVLVDVSLMRGATPSKWEHYAPTLVDWGIFAGTLAFFLMLYALFVRFVPIVSVHEVRELIHEQEEEGCDD